MGYDREHMARESQFFNKYHPQNNLEISMDHVSQSTQQNFKRGYEPRSTPKVTKEYVDNKRS